MSLILFFVASSQSAVARDVDYPVLIPSPTMARETSRGYNACESKIVYKCVCLRQNA